MDIRTFRTEPSYKANPVRSAPPVSSGTLLDDWSERTFGAFRNERHRPLFNRAGA
ncbi:hypothetical protein [Sphingomonas crocodyli]|uniref:hypothetical protein n=1 Tax=Sphingomonas crocodyli TaxID=1979270 RepID=UPI0013E357CB|nr:hypothetical protein [Sphingomonas crocodyli]